MSFSPPSPSASIPNTGHERFVGEDTPTCPLCSPLTVVALPHVTNETRRRSATAPFHLCNKKIVFCLFLSTFLDTTWLFFEALPYCLSVIVRPCEAPPRGAPMGLRGSKAEYTAPPDTAQLLTCCSWSTIGQMQSLLGEVAGMG